MKIRTVEEEPVTIVYGTIHGVFSEEENMRRPVLATINNHPLARPQSGISEADIVYEFVAEGNVTRLLALFQSELPEEIGPIRSARDYFIHIAKGLDAFYVAHGYSPDARALLQTDFVDNVNGMQYDGTLFKRSTIEKHLIIRIFRRKCTCSVRRKRILRWKFSNYRHFLSMNLLKMLK